MVNYMNIRPAKIQDSKKISSLMDQLGYGASGQLIEKKLTEFAKTPIDTVFVAEVEGLVVGVISCHITSLFHQAGSSGRITSMVIEQKHRGQGVGKCLVSEAEAFFQSSGCVKSEVTSGDHRPEAHAFYESCGYKLDERRFIKLYR
jgi:N-acetylglutamate synthase-like GNAT family acetyltransferase